MTDTTEETRKETAANEEARKVAAKAEEARKEAASKEDARKVASNPQSDTKHWYGTTNPTDAGKGNNATGNTGSNVDQRVNVGSRPGAVGNTTQEDAKRLVSNAYHDITGSTRTTVTNTHYGTTGTDSNGHFVATSNNQYGSNGQNFGATSNRTGDGSIVDEHSRFGANGQNFVATGNNRPGGDDGTQYGGADGQHFADGQHPDPRDFERDSQNLGNEGRTGVGGQRLGVGGPNANGRFGVDSQHLGVGGLDANNHPSGDWIARDGVQMEGNFVKKVRP